MDMSGQGWNSKDLENLTFESSILYSSKISNLKCVCVCMSCSCCMSAGEHVLVCVVDFCHCNLFAELYTLVSLMNMDNGQLYLEYHCQAQHDI